MISRATARIGLAFLLAARGERQAAPAAPTEIGLDVSEALATSEVVEGEIGPGVNCSLPE
jgi:hypothetical protein